MSNRKKKFKKKVVKQDSIENTDAIQVWFDGACAPINPKGHIGIGCLIIQNDKRIFEYSGYVDESPNNSNNVAEYLALQNCLDFLLENGFQNDKIVVKGDSSLVANQMNNIWKIKDGLYRHIAIDCKSKAGFFSDISFKWIPRELNEEADRLSNVVFIQKGIKLFDASDKKKQKDKYKVKYNEPKNKFNDSLLNVKFNFGKYNTFKVSDVPQDYLNWMLVNFEFNHNNEKLKNAVIYVTANRMLEQP